jgi:hypothetical protein
MCGLALVRSFGNIAEDTSLTLPEPADHFDQYPRRTMYACYMYSYKHNNHVTKLLCFLRKPLVPGMGYCYLPSIRGFTSFPGSRKAEGRICLHRRGKESRGGTTRYDMNESFQMQRGKNWIFPKEMTGTLIGWKSGQTTYFPLRDQMKGSWLWTKKPRFRRPSPPLQLGRTLIRASSAIFFQPSGTVVSNYLTSF